MHFKLQNRTCCGKDKSLLSPKIVCYTTGYHELGSLYHMVYQLKLCTVKYYCTFRRTGLCSNGIHLYSLIRFIILPANLIHIHVLGASIKWYSKSMFELYLESFCDSFASCRHNQSVRYIVRGIKWGSYLIH